MRNLLTSIGVLVLVSLLILVAKAFTTPSVQPQPAPVTQALPNETRMAEILSAAVKLNTVSTTPDHTAFAQFRELLRASFPRAHRDLTLDVVNQHSLLYTWHGSDTSLPPALFTAHYDVVDVEPGDTWEQPPFSGALVDGFVWGRGSMDDKAAIVAMLSAVEALLDQGVTPKRTVLIALGHDEEIGGQNGARAIAELLTQRGIKPEFLLDEGMPITKGILAGAKSPVALIGIAEKSYMTLELTVQGEGGHSSSPPPNTAVGVLAQAIARIEANPMPARLDGPVGKMFDALAPEMPLVQRVVLSNRWLFAPLLEKQLARKPSTNAMMRTTAAATMFQGSVQANVLPTEAKASVNFRILPGDSIEVVTQHIKTVVNDERVQIKIAGEAIEPSKTSDANSAAFKTIATTVREIFPDTLVAPTLLIASTDTKHYSALVDNAYRFRPLWIANEDVKRFHGVNERISAENLAMMGRFYARLIFNLLKRSA